MKKLFIFLSLTALTCSASVMAQGICNPPCTPDVSCVDLINPGEICPEVLPTANVGTFYDETVTVIPPSSYQGFPIVGAIRIDQVNGLPAGMTWCKSSEKFNVTTPYTRYCCQLSGTPTTPGTYQLSLLITPYIGLVPSPQITDDTSLVIIVLPAAPVAAFSGTPTSIEAGMSVTFTDQSTNNPTGLSWVFESGNPPTSSASTQVVTYALSGSYDVTLTAINDGGENTLTKSEYIIVSSSSDDNTPLMNKVKIYPNPASHKLTVEATNLESISIVDVLGKVVYTQIAKSDNETIDVSSLLKANYFIKVKTTEGEITKTVTIR